MDIKEQFLPEEVFQKLRTYCKENEFKIHKRGEKEFRVLPTPDFLLEYLQIPDHELHLTFIRSANKDFDIDMRIHADNIIEGKKTALASVLYISTPAETSANGTAFWKHNIHGTKLPIDVTNEEFDRLIIEDSNDLDKWLLEDIVWAEPNRQVVYDSNSFHSKWPNKIDVGTRIVLVCFYTKNHFENYTY
jgi:hypothetical protein